MELMEIVRKWKRNVDSYFTYRRTFILIVIIFGLILYIGPNLLRRFSHPKINVQDVAESCLADRLSSFYSESEEFNANIQHNPPQSHEKLYLPYVGNGIFGIEAHPSSSIYIKSGRVLTLPVYFQPLVTVTVDSRGPTEANVVHYTTGIVHKFQCFSSGLYITYQYYAHRTIPSLFVQSIKMTNPTNENFKLNIHRPRVVNWPTAVSRTINFQQDNGLNDYQVTSGMVEVPSGADVIAVSLVSTKLSTSVEVKSRSSTVLDILTTIDYSEPINKADFPTRRDIVEKRAVEHMKQALSKSQQNLKEHHINVWQQLWSTGLTISYSKANKAINGNNINATMYYVLSQVPSPYHEESTTKERKAELANSLFYAEGCYGGYHTLHADNLWRDLSTLEEVNTAVSLWLLTLEKQGCHNLLRAGASGVAQAMVLSFGSLRFSNQHLEFNIHPKHLHRDYLFRRISYGNLTHVNISVVVQEDNKAVLYVALDRSDRSYYACDGGCVDNPVQLGPTKKQFPVKLTDPVTAILYITYDKQHMEDLRLAIHVKEIVEAPAHEHHVIALHKHGHHLGGLPTLFWVSICFLIIIFHLFLCKLIYNEYCGTQDKFRSRYGKA